MRKEIVFIDEETLTPEELEAIADEQQTEENLAEMRAFGASM